MDWLPITAFVVSLLALALSGINSWVNYRNRADKHTVWMTLVRSVSSESRKFGSTSHWISREVWKLSNGGEATVMMPNVVVTLRDGRSFAFTCDEPVLGKQTVEIKPVGELPREEEGPERGGSVKSLLDLMGARGKAQWRGPNGKLRTASVEVQDS